MRVLVTGGTGYLGSCVARHLREAGHEPVFLLRSEGQLEGLPPSEARRGDVRDLLSFQNAAQGCDAIVHMAALVKMWVPDRTAFETTNVLGLKNAIAAARSAGARLVYTSSFIALGPAGPEPANEEHLHPEGRYLNDYERTKAAADALARHTAASGADIVILYPGVVYGPGALTDGNLVVGMVLDHMKGRFPGIIGPGDRLWSYSYVEDVAIGHIKALEKGGPGEGYLLAGENVDMNGFFQILERVSGVGAPKRHIPYKVASLLGRALYSWAELTGQPPLLTHEVVNVFREHWAYSSAKAERDLGFRSRTLVEGLRSTVEWLRAEGLA